MPINILVVDDEPDLQLLFEHKFKGQISDNTYRFLFALDGNEALKAINTHENIDIILSDINMPGMDGLTLLAEINKLNTFQQVVIISAYGDMENIRTAMNRGAFDFITKPINFEDLEITIRKTKDLVDQLKSSAKKHEENIRLKIANEELHKLVEHEQMLSNMKDEFTSNINHELRTPLTSLLLATNYLLKKLDDLSKDTIRSKLQRIEESANDLHNLVNELLDYAQLEGGHYSCNLSILDIKHVFQRLKDTFEPMFFHKKLRFHFDQPEELSIVNDPSHIYKILANLLSNAYKFTESGEVSLEAIKKGEQVLFSVSDTGYGVRDEDKDTIFKRFTQGTIYDNKAPGTGIGLHMVKQIVENHGGRVTLDSKVGVGSTFTVTLPLNSKWNGG